MTAPRRLSVLDLSPISAGATAQGALHGTIELARHAEQLGLTRYWLAEHHNAGSLACSSPELMVALVASATTTIRVGAGGIMLPNHSPLKVAELFRVLSALFPGRIDLGLGRAGGTDARAARALRRHHEAPRASTPPDPGGAGFAAQLDELFGYLWADDAAPRGAFSGTVRAIPTGVAPPAPWILASSEVGVSLAAGRGLPLAFGHHLNPDQAAALGQRYREDFQPSAVCAKPELILAASALCAETDAEAERLASSAELSWVRFCQGLRDYPLPSVEEAMSHRWEHDEHAMRATQRARAVVGSAARVASRLIELADAAGADELMILTHVHDPEARRRSYTLLAEAIRGA